MIKGVVCLSILDAYHYLIDSYRPYQLRNNNLAAAFDGVHGRAVQVSRWGWLFCRTPRRRRSRPCPALAGQRRAGPRRASPQEEDERIAAYEKHSLPSGKYHLEGITTELAKGTATRRADNTVRAKLYHMRLPQKKKARWQQPWWSSGSLRATPLSHSAVCP